MEDFDMADYFIEARETLEEVNEYHYGDAYDEPAAMVAAIASIIIKHIKEDK